MPSDKSPLREEAAHAFARRYGRQPEIVVRAPGRVNLLGAHIDYSEGWVITGAIDRAVWLAAAPAAGDSMRITALDYDDERTLDPIQLPPPLTERRNNEASWIDYPAGVVWALAEAGHRPPTLDVTFASDVPIGAGLSSSAAVEMAFLLAFESLDDSDRKNANNFGLGGADRARIGMRAENEYLGVPSGIMDQFSSLHGASGKLLFLDCRSLAYKHLPLPESARVLVADSGTCRQLTGIDYGNRRQECEEAVDLLAPHLPSPDGRSSLTLRDVSVNDFELHSHHLPMPLRRRARHAVEECQRTRAGAGALRQGDLDAFGHLMRQSQLSSRDLYEVSTPELDLLAATAWAAPGCYGARLAGAGFGGCLIVLAEAEAVPSVKRAMLDAFEGTFGHRPKIFSCAIGNGASVISRP